VPCILVQESYTSFANSNFTWTLRVPTNFLKINSNISIFFISNQSFFITFQINKSLQNKKFYFSIQNILTFFLISIKSVIVLNTSTIFKHTHKLS
jgi:hypothetical protein